MALCLSDSNQASKLASNPMPESFHAVSSGVPIRLPTEVRLVDPVGKKYGFRLSSRRPSPWRASGSAEASSRRLQAASTRHCDGCGGNRFEASEWTSRPSDTVPLGRSRRGDRPKGDVSVAASDTAELAGPAALDPLKSNSFNGVEVWRSSRSIQVRSCRRQRQARAARPHSLAYHQARSRHRRTHVTSGDRLHIILGGPEDAQRLQIGRDCGRPQPALRSRIGGTSSDQASETWRENHRVLGIKRVGRPS